LNVIFLCKDPFLTDVNHMIQPMKDPIFHYLLDYYQPVQQRYVIEQVDYIRIYIGELEPYLQCHNL